MVRLRAPMPSANEHRDAEACTGIPDQPGLRLQRIDLHARPTDQGR